MPTSHLDTLAPVLTAIPDEEITAPTMPVAVVLQEAHDLATLIQQPAVSGPMAAVGLAPDAPAQLALAVGAARTAESRWTVTRDRNKSDAQREREERGQHVRAELLATSRYALRNDRTGSATVAAIGEGDGVPDLIQDLYDLGALIEHKSEAYAPDTTFNPAAAAEEARSLASAIAEGTSAERLDTTQMAAKQLRDRAFTHLSALVSSIREAGRYAHRKNAALAARFTSAYVRARRLRSAARRAAASPPAAGNEPKS